MLMEHAPVSFPGWKQELRQGLVAPVQRLAWERALVAAARKTGFPWRTEATYHAGGLRNPLDVAPAI